MRKRIPSRGVAVIGIAAAVIWATLAVLPSNLTGADNEQLERGAYLVNFGGCHDCHTPKVFTDGVMGLDSTHLLAGHPAEEAVPEIPEGVIGPGHWGALTNDNLTMWAGPWGISFASNLTPDKKTGLGEWSEEQFIKAIRTGKHRGFGRSILPPMPWDKIAGATDEDLGAIFAYIQSLPAINNKVPDPVPPAGK